MINNYKLDKLEQSLLDNQIIEQYCKYCNIDINYNIKPNEQNGIDEITVAMFLALNKLIPPEQWQHDIYLENKNKETVGQILGKNGIIPPENWFYYKFNYMRQYSPIQSELQECRAPFPYYYPYNTYSSYYVNNPKITIFSHACFKEIPSIKDHKPEEQNEGGWTIAMILAYQGIVPPRQWMHSDDIVNFYGRNLQFYLNYRNLPIPQHWNDNDLDIFDKACYGEIPQIEDHFPEEQNEHDDTIAMILQKLNIRIPDDWIHEPDIQNNDGETIAMIQAKQGRIPTKRWQHNKFLRCLCFKQYKKQQSGYITITYPSSFYTFDKNENQFEYNTVQDILQQQNIEVPKQWQYSYKDQNQNTEAMLQAEQGIIPKKQEYDDVMQNNKNCDTVALILAKKRIVPPQEWMHDISYQNANKQSIKSLLLQHDYIYKNDKFVLKYKVQKVNNKCQMCQKQQEQDFIQTKCGHKICLQCFKQLESNKKDKKCPICKQNNWYYQVDK